MFVRARGHYSALICFLVAMFWSASFAIAEPVRCKSGLYCAQGMVCLENSLCGRPNPNVAAHCLPNWSYSHSPRTCVPPGGVPCGPSYCPAGGTCTSDGRCVGLPAGDKCGSGTCTIGDKCHRNRCVEPGTFLCKTNNIACFIGNYCGEVPKCHVPVGEPFPQVPRSALLAATGPSSSNRPSTGRSPSTSDPRNCIKERVWDTDRAWLKYNFTNTCERVIAFEIDDCSPAAGSGVECKVRTITLSRSANEANNNYRRKPNARNFR